MYRIGAASKREPEKDSLARMQILTKVGDDVRDHETSNSKRGHGQPATGDGGGAATENNLLYLVHIQQQRGRMIGGFHLSLCLYWYICIMVNGGLIPPSPPSPKIHVSPRCVRINAKSTNSNGQGKVQHYHRKHPIHTGNNIIESMTQMDSLNRRRELMYAAAHLSVLLPPIMHPPWTQAMISSGTQTTFPRGVVFEIKDPSTYSAVVYVPRAKTNGQSKTTDEAPDNKTEYPMLVVLHGAGSNEHSAMYEFTNSGSPTSPPGNHVNLPPYLLAQEQAPHVLSDNFVVVAPYVGRGKSGSLYDEPRGKILSFIKWFNNWIESQLFEDDAGISSCAIHRHRISLFGFSEGSTLAVELATTRQFNGVILASYGFTGTLPPLALERLYEIPIWVFHSTGDDVFDIRYSNKLVESLVSYHGGKDIFDTRKTVKYTKLISVKTVTNENGLEHVRAALVASKSEETFHWLLSLPCSPLVDVSLASSHVCIGM